MQQKLSLLLLCGMLFLSGCLKKDTAVDSLKQEKKSVKSAGSHKKKSKKEEKTAYTASLYNGDEEISFFDEDELNKLAFSPEEHDVFDDMVSEHSLARGDVDESLDDFSFQDDSDAVRQQIDELVALWKSEEGSDLAVDFKTLYFEPQNDDTIVDELPAVDASLSDVSRHASLDSSDFTQDDDASVLAQLLAPGTEDASLLDSGSRVDDITTA